MVRVVNSALERNTIIIIIMGFGITSIFLSSGYYNSAIYSLMIGISITGIGSASLKGKLVLLSPIAMRQSLSLLVISALIVFVLAFAGLARLMRKTNPNRRN